MARFRVADRVKILSVVETPFVGLEGNICEVQLHEHSISVLDRYIVVFAWGEKETFYDVQLEHVSHMAKAADASL